MKIAIFNPYSGISGNMILGSLVDNGLDVNELISNLKKLPLEGWDIAATKVVRGGLMGTHIEVSVPHEHAHRHLSDIVKIIEPAPLEPWVKNMSLKAFRLLAEAEAEAHGIGVDEVHFHEVGAMDAIIDVVGSCIGLNLLGVEAVYSGAVSVGTGTVECAHGTMPVPAPATARLLRGVSTVQTQEPNELTTPTGAAILTALVESWEAPPVYSGLSSGMGAGSREGETRANLLRLLIGETLQTEDHTNDKIMKIEALIDDMNPRIWPGLSEKILSAGALDCYARNCMGKKGRPALELVVQLPESVLQEVLDVVFTQSSTLGVRLSEEKRVVLRREFTQISTAYGDVSVKLGYYKDKLVSAEPEFENCVVLAEAAGVPVKVVLQEAGGKAADLFEKG